MTLGITGILDFHDTHSVDRLIADNVSLIRDTCDFN